MFLSRTNVLLPLALLVACGGQAPETGTVEEETAEVGSMLPSIEAINAFYYYQDVEAAWVFYTETLGFKTVADYGFAKILQVGPTSYLTLVDETQGMHSSSEPKSVTLAVVTDEVEGWWEYLSEAGVEMRSALGPEDGQPQEGRPHDGFVAIDPEGYLLEFERFNEHAENVHLLPILNSVQPIYPDGSETAPGITSPRPASLGVQGTVFWLYYAELEPIETFYRNALEVDILVDQGWAKVYPASTTGFLGFVDGARGLHQATEEKAVTVSFFTSELESWLEHLATVDGFELRTSEISAEVTDEGDFVHTFVGYDPAGYFLEWDEFLQVQVNTDLLRALGSVSSGS